MYKINLIRKQVPNRHLRKMLFWGMLGYLVLACAGLAFVAHHSALRFVKSSRRLREVKAVERQVLAGKKADRGVVAYAVDLRPKLVKASKILSGIDNSLKHNIDFVSILIGIAEPLPADSLLVGVDLKVDDGTIRFDIMTPAAKNSVHSAGQLIDTWNRVGVLKKLIGDIRAEESRREFRSGQAVIIHSFSAKVDSEK